MMSVGESGTGLKPFCLQIRISGSDRAIDTQIAVPLGLSVEAAARGVIRLAAAGIARGLRGVAWAKGHVPAHKAQVCHKGRTLVVGAAAVEGHLRHGDCTLPANDPENVFFKGDPCPNVDDNNDGACDL